MTYLQFVGEDMNVGPAMSKARLLANEYFAEHLDCDVLSEQLVVTTTVAQKTIVIILLRVSAERI